MIDEYRYKLLEDETAETLKSERGTLHAVVVGSTPDQEVKIYDSSGTGGTQIAELKASIEERTYGFDCMFAEGLHVENKGKGKVTVIYR